MYRKIAMNSKQLNNSLLQPEAKVKSINTILIWAVIVRILVLVIILAAKDKIPAIGFMGNTIKYDDYRYTQGAMLYAEKANGLYDITTFRMIFDSMQDWTGYHLDNWFTVTPFWYWFLCDFMYLIHISFFMRLINIFFMVLTIKYVYMLTNLLYDHKTARTASYIIAFSPYTIIFSCFMYKDCFVAFCTFFLMYIAVRIKKHMRLKKCEAIGSIIIYILLLITRSGLSVILLGCLFLYIYWNRIISRMNYKTLLFLIVGIAITGILLIFEGDTLILKFMAYNGENAVGNEIGIGSLLKIQSFLQFWKLPLTYVFSILQPIRPFQKIDTWYGLVCNLNVLMAPIVVGSLFYIFRTKKNNNDFFWISLIYYLISAASSILIYRQLFSVLMIPVIYFSAFYNNAGKTQKTVMWASSIGLSICLICLFLVI